MRRQRPPAQLPPVDAVSQADRLGVRHQLSQLLVIARRVLATDGGRSREEPEGLIPRRNGCHELPKYYTRIIVGQNDDKKLYHPFFELNTVACFTAKEEQKQQLYSNGAIPGFPQAAIFGRPLFAYCFSEGELDDAKLTEFALRLVLSEKNYDNRLPRFYSVLGARSKWESSTASTRFPPLLAQAMHVWSTFNSKRTAFLPLGAVDFYAGPSLRNFSHEIHE